MNTINKDNVWFSFNGRRNTDPALDVRMLSMPTRPHPARKGKHPEVPARDDDLWQDEGGYKRIKIPINLIAPDNDNIDEVNAWLNGAGDLIFGDEPNRAYHARITEEFSRINRAQRLRGQEFTVTFDCEPCRYSANPDGDITNVLASGEKITNPGTENALPLLKVNGSAAGTLMIGQNTLLFSAFPASIYVDCAAKVAYTGEGTAADPMLPATQHVTGEWITIEPGNNFVTFTGGITSVTIVPRWRWL